MKSWCVLKGIAFLAGMVFISGITPGEADAGYYVSKHSGSGVNSHSSGKYYATREPWLDVDIVRTEPVRVVEHRTVEHHHHYYNDDNDYRHHRPHKFYRHHYHKKHRLPPGWYSRVRRGCVMPADLYVYREPVPQYVMVQMPPQPPGVVHVMIGGKVIRLMEATRTIMDVFEI